MDNNELNISIRRLVKLTIIRAGMTPFQNPTIPASLYTSLAFSSNQNFILALIKVKEIM
jgi:hypothetical protein